MAESLTAAKIAKLMEEWAPLSLAYEWDNVGLQVGTLKKDVSKVLITLDVIETVVDEAIEKNADFIIAHHPLLFKPIIQLDSDSPRGRVIEKLLRHGITVYAAHTNLDITDGGVSDMLADLLGLEETQVLASDKQEKLYKLAVFVPKTHAEQLRQALGDAGAGYIGDYSHCSFQTAGQGSFQPQEGSDPYLGKTGELERVDEIKIETIISQSDVKKIQEVVYETHPYEEPAFDLFPLANQGKTLGAGRIGILRNELTVKELCELIKNKWDIPHLRVTGNIDQQVKKVAVLGGSGESFINEAKAKNADVYITGDLTFHPSQDTWQEGMVLIDAGHYAEKVMKKFVKQYLDEQLGENGLQVIESEVDSNPFQYL